MARRRGAFSITAALLTIGLVAAAGLVVWFLMTATRGATSSPMLVVVGTPTYDSGSGTLYFTLKNIGTEPVDPASIEVVGASSTSCNATGQLIQCTATFTAAPTSSQAIVRTPSGEITLAFTRV